MDLFEHRYYRLNKTFMMLLGQWPCQSAHARRRIAAVLFFIAITGLPPPMLAIVKYCNDSNIFLECVTADLFCAASLLKLLRIIWNSHKILELFHRILRNWQALVRCREINILHEYSQQGEKMSIVYTAAIYLSTTAFMIQPMIPKIIDIVLRNGTEIGKFLYLVDYYYFDVQEYYFYISLHCWICAMVAAMCLVASDITLIIFVQHVCGVFAAIGHKLERIGNNYTSVENYEHLNSLIDVHNDAIEYANLIEATYTWDFFFTIGIGMILLNILGVQILLGTNEPESTIKFIAFVVALLLAFYMICNISQVLVDHSNNISFHIYNSRWYRLSPRDQKLLQMMIMRCRIPCQLTAGKMLSMSMRNFGLTIRTAMSYFAVIRPQ